MMRERPIERKWGTSEFVVRSPRADELGAVGELTVAAYRTDGLLEGDADYVQELADAARRAAKAELLVAVGEDGELLGSVTVVRPHTAYAEISRKGELEFRMLATAPAARRRGVGEALVHAVLERARALDAKRVVMCSLDTMHAAHRLYTRIGFTLQPERDWEPSPGFWLRAFALTLEL